MISKSQIRFKIRSKVDISKPQFRFKLFSNVVNLKSQLRFKMGWKVANFKSKFQIKIFAVRKLFIISGKTHERPPHRECQDAHTWFNQSIKVLSGSE